MASKKAAKVQVGDALADGHSVVTVRHHFPKAGQVTFVLEDARMMTCELGYLLDVTPGPRSMELEVNTGSRVDSTLID